MSDTDDEMLRLIVEPSAPPEPLAAELAWLARDEIGPLAVAGRVLPVARALYERGAHAGAARLLRRLAAEPLVADLRREVGQLLAKAERGRGDHAAALAAWETLARDEELSAAARASAAARRARLLARRGRHDEAAAALAFAEALGGLEVDGQADLELARVLLAAHEDPGGYAPDLRRVEELRREGASGARLAKLGEAIGVALYRANRLEAARAVLERAERDAREAGASGAQGGAALNLGVVALRAGESERAARETERARRFFAEAGDLRGVATADLELGLGLLRAGRYSGCVERLGSALGVFVALGEEALVGEIYMNRGAARLRLGALASARRDLEAALAATEGGLRLFVLGDLALLEALAGRSSEAEARLAEAAAQAARSDAFWRAQAAVQAAQALSVAGAAQRALERAREAVTQAEEQELTSLLPAARTALAEALLEHGEESGRSDPAGSVRCTLSDPAESARPRTQGPAGDGLSELSKSEAPHERTPNLRHASDKAAALGLSHEQAASQRARAAAEAALEVAQGADRPRAEAALARALARLGEGGEALAAAQRGLEGLAASEDVLDGLAVRLARADALVEAGRADEALALLAPALGAASSTGLSTLARATEEALRRALGEDADSTARALQRLDLLSGGGGDEVGGLLAKVVGGGTDPGHMLDLAIGLLVEATGAERGLLVLLDEEGEPTETAARNLRDEELSGPRFSYSRRLVQAAASERQPVLIPDALNDPRFAEAESVATLAIRSVLAVPVLGEREGDPPVLAVLYLDDRTQTGRFDPEARELARRLSAELAPAFRLARERARLEQDVAGLRSRVQEADLAAATAELVGASAPLRQLIDTIARAARTELPVLIEGESGAGKELVARAIHAAGRRKRGPFVGESCAALADSLLERELFGHVQGAFTGADQDRPGILQAASGGTLFLDEVNSMSPALQAKLLRALQEKQIRPVGSERLLKVDVRVIAASNEPLTALVEQGRFRQDLYYRLAVMPVRVPPLRERPDDVPLLVDHFVRKHGEEGAAPVFADAALRTLSAYPWPGNVRELENTVRRALALRVDRVLVRHLPVEVRASAKDARPGAAPLPAEETSLPEALERLERELIERALRAVQGNVSQAARRLGIERTKLGRRIKALGIEAGKAKRREED